MTRKLSATEVKVTLASIARVPPDDVDGYIVVLVKGADVTATFSNATDLATQVAILARAIEHAAVDVGELENAHD
jgi:hypothetical protein